MTVTGEGSADEKHGGDRQSQEEVVAVPIHDFGRSPRPSQYRPGEVEAGDAGEGRGGDIGVRGCV